MEVTEPHKLNFFLVFVKSNKKLTKYFKINRTRNKCVIDIKKIMEEEELTLSDVKSAKFFKILIYKKILLAQEKKKDIYYIPNFDNEDLNIERMIKLKTLSSHNFNLLFFYNEFKNDDFSSQILEHLDVFSVSAIIKDY